jgi:hypothetical protein
LTGTNHFQKTNNLLSWVCLSSSGILSVHNNA